MVTSGLQWFAAKNFMKKLVKKTLNNFPGETNVYDRADFQVVYV